MVEREAVLGLGRAPASALVRLLLKAPAAIVGLAARLPGAPDLSSFWKALESGASTVAPAPKGRWLTERFWHPRTAEAGFSYTFAGGYLDDPFSFDPLAFGISPREAAQMDPQQRLLLEVVWEALEDAGIAPASLAGQEVGVYVGASNVDYQAFASVDHAAIESHFVTGIALSIASNRISYVLDLKGPSMTIDTACSSSIVALVQACEAIASGRIETAIVAGVNLLLSPVPYIGFSRARMLSPTGLCRPFSADADGYVRSEGAVALVLRRLDAATSSGDRVRSVVLGAGVNSDGRTVGVSLPSVEGQRSLLEDVYRRSDIDPDALSFVEAHGTGTPVGDPIEARAIGEALGRRRTRPLPVGSVKSNIGHLESASGMAALAKVVLSLERGVYPRTIHLERPSAAIPLEELNLELARSDLPLAGPGPIVAGVCNYGFGGTNAHAVLRAPSAQEAEPPHEARGERARALVISAHSEGALRALAARYAGLAREPSRDVTEIASAAAARRGLLAHRAVVPLADRERLVSDLEGVAAGREPAGASVVAASTADPAPVALVFPGNGCQWTGMGRAALARSAAFARQIDAVDAILLDVAGWSAREALLAPDLAERLAATSIAQPLVFAIQSALRATLAEQGLAPVCVLGHSVGEVAAAEASGALDREQAVALIVERSRHQERARGLGGMVAASLGEAAARDLIEEIGTGLELAAVNAPSSVTFSGPDLALRRLLDVARRRRVATIRLDIDYPFHSGLLDPIQADLVAGLADLKPGAADIPMMSCVTGAPIAGCDLDAGYWWRNVRQPVRFREAVEAAIRAGARCFVEIAPRPILIGAVAETARSLDVQVTALRTLSEADDESGQDPILASACRLVAHGAIAPRSDLVGSGRRWAVDLPSYPWQRSTHVMPATSERIEAFGSMTGGARHPLAGTRMAAGSPEWRATLDPAVVPFLADHKVGDEVVVPGAGLLEMVLFVGREMLGEGPLAAEDFDIFKALVLSAEAMREVSVRFEHHLSRVEIWSRPRFADDWTLHAAGRLSRPDAEPVPPFARPDPDRAVRDDQETVYHAAARAGLHYGASFRRALCVLRDDTRLVTTLAPVRPDTGAFADDFVLDPTALDAALHGIFSARPQKQGETVAHLPVRVRRVRVWRPGARPSLASARIVRETDRGMVLALRLEDEDGACIAEVEGAYLRGVALARANEDERRLSCRTELLAAAAEEPHSTAGLIADREVPAAWLLTRAGIVSTVHEALSTVSAGGQVDPNRAVGQDRSRDPVLRAALDLLRAEGIAELGADGWTLAEESGYPGPDALIATLIERFPGAQADLLLLLDLRKRLEGALRGEGPCPAEATRRAIEAESTAFAPFVATLEAEIATLQRSLAPRRARVLVVCPCPAAVLHSLARAHESGAIELAALVGDRGEAGALPRGVRVVSASDLDGGRPTLRLADLVVAAPFGRPVPLPEAAALLLAPRCRALAMALPQNDVFDLLFALGRSSEDGGEAASDDTSDNSREIERLLRRLGFSFEASAPSLAPTPIIGHRDVALEERPAPDVLLTCRDGSLVDPRLAEVLVSHAGPAPVLVDLPGPNREADSAPANLEARALRLAGCFRDLAARETRPPVFVVTRGALGSASMPNPGADAIWSFVRVAMNEYPQLDIRLVDLDPALGSEEAAARLQDVLCAPGQERELLVATDGLRVPRVLKGLRPEPAPGEGWRSVLQAGATTSLDDFAWRWERRREPARGEIEIEIAATGLNFRDVMVGMNILDDDLLGGGLTLAALGFECAGRIARVGEGVRDLKPGDLVMGFAPSAFASHLTAPCGNFVPAPAGFTAEQAATCPVVFATAWYALVEAGRLRAGDVVLVHGGAGGVGMAAIQIARSLGARVLATAGTAERRHLAELVGADAVYDSRSLRFAQQIHDEHGGVDLVLNSLSGEAMRAGLGLLRPFGRFVELGKRDFLENSAVGLRPFVRNLSYFGVDLDELLAHDRDAVTRALKEVVSRLEAGTLSPLPYRAFAGERVADAFRLLQRSGHVGKVLVRPPERALAARPDHRFRPAPGAHVVVGGTGGFGLETALWLAERGAERVVVASRRGAVAREDADRLARFGDAIEVEQVDATDPSSVDAMLARVRARAGAVAGVIHTAMVLEDGLIESLERRALERVLAPKVVGVEALDAATRADQLQYFVVYSSATTLIGNPGQAAYVLANGYLEGFMRMRRARGEPGLAVAWGAISDAGVIARDRGLGERLARTTGVTGIPAREALAFLESLLARGSEVGPVHAFSAVGRSAVADSLALLASPAFAELAPTSGVRQASGSDLASAISGKTDSEARGIVIAVLVSEIARILRVAEDGVSPMRPLAEIGMDSLMALELRLGLEERLGIELPLLSLGEKSVSDVAGHVLARLRSSSGGAGLAETVEYLAGAHGADAIGTAEAAALARGLEIDRDRNGGL
jgi:phthiocerol/phenolphthiocerol synthesis type-I polyketide synthase C